jgi:hypothetical protein
MTEPSISEVDAAPLPSRAVHDLPLFEEAHGAQDMWPTVQVGQGFDTLRCRSKVAGRNALPVKSGRAVVTLNFVALAPELECGPKLPTKRPFGAQFVPAASSTTDVVGHRITFIVKPMRSLESFSCCVFSLDD